jgi:hypothetical protein
MSIDDNNIFLATFVDDDLLSLLETHIFSSTFQRRFAQSSKLYSILIMSSTSAVKALDKALDAWDSRYRYFSYAWV